MTASEQTREWLARTLTAEELTSWGAVTIRALAQLVDNLDLEGEHPDDHR